jgi:hypothetical protein
MKKLICVSIAVFILMACSHSPEKGALSVLERNSYATQGKLRTHGLTIIGYNYTDYGFYSYQVDYRGGGNLEPSTLTAGGSKSTCCFSLYTPMSDFRKVKVKWSRGLSEDIWCEMNVPLKGPLPAKPEYLEVHFYQDGHVELAITEEPSPPRLKLERFDNDQRHATGNVINDDKFAVCKHGY